MAGQEESLSGASLLLRGPEPEGGEGGVEGREEDGKECRERDRNDRVWGE